MRSELRREVFTRPTRQQSGRLGAHSATADAGVADVDGGAGDVDDDERDVGDGTARPGSRDRDDGASAFSSASSHSDATFELRAADNRAVRGSRKRSRSVPFSGRVVCIAIQCSV